MHPSENLNNLPKLKEKSFIYFNISLKPLTPLINKKALKRLPRLLRFALLSSAVL